MPVEHQTYPPINPNLTIHFKLTQESTEPSSLRSRNVKADLGDICSYEQSYARRNIGSVNLSD